MPQVRADYLIRPNERPAIGMKLGGGYVKLCQKLPLEASEGKAKLDFLEHGGIDKTEGSAVAPLVVSTNGFPARARTNGHLVVVLFAERKVNGITFLKAEDINIGVDGGGLTQQSGRGPGVQLLVVWKGSRNRTGVRWVWL